MGEAGQPEESPVVEAEVSVAEPPSRPVVRTRPDALASKATELIKTFVTVLTDNTDLTTLKNAVMSACTLRQSENGNNRICIADPGLDAEPSAAFTKSHDVFGRQPGSAISLHDSFCISGPQSWKCIVSMLLENSHNNKKEPDLATLCLRLGFASLVFSAQCCRSSPSICMCCRTLGLANQWVSFVVNSSCLVLFGVIWSHLELSSKVVLESFQVIGGSFGVIWSHWGSLGVILESFGVVWSRLGSLGVIEGRSESFGFGLVGSFRVMSMLLGVFWSLISFRPCELLRLQNA